MAIYLDHNATTPLHEVAFEAMRPYMGQVAGNPSSLHRFGRLQRDAVEHAREQVASLAGARPEQVIFTSGGTEANNLILKGLCAASGLKRIAVSSVEHMSLIEPAMALQKTGLAVDRVAVDEEGRVTEAMLQHAIKSDTALVSVMSANNETGLVQDVATLASLAHEQGAWLHTDASQQAGKLELDFAGTAVDAMTLSAHKIYGPPGAGALIVDKRLPLHSIMQGGSQEKGLRPGTENVPAIVGFGAAAELARSELDSRATHVKQLREALESRLAACDDVAVFAQNSLRLPNTLQFGVSGFDGETLLMQFDRKGIAVSSGSACTSGKSEPSHVLQAMGVPAEIATSAVRVSFGKDNSLADVDVFMQAFADIIEMKSSSVMKAATM